MTVDEMQKRRKELGYTYADLSALTGVPVGTVQKILGGFTRSPRYKTMQALERVLRRPAKQPVEDNHEAGMPGGGRSDSYDAAHDKFNKEKNGDVSFADRVSEPGNAYYSDLDFNPNVPKWARNAKYPRQGSYTVDDYLALPDDQRVELIDGVFYDMSSPLSVHQLIVGKLFEMLHSHQADHPGCHVFFAPMDVQLDCDNRTMVEPDVFVLCDRKKITRARTVGAPDLVIEVLSDSTRKKDLQIKLGKYGRAGVREYWMVDPDNRTVIVYDFEHDDIIHMYTFNDIVPVAITDAEISIDFREVQKEIAFLDEPDDGSDEE